MRNALGEIVGIMLFIADVTERKRSEAMIRRMAYYDPVTDLPNRTLMRDRLHQAILAASYENQSACLLLIKLDRFKEINNALGHHRGDALLQQIGPRLQTLLNETDLIARVGGNEFAVLLPLGDRPRATEIAGQILNALERPFLIEGIPMIVGCSIGIALSPDHGGNPDSLIQRADVAMYFASENKTATPSIPRRLTSTARAVWRSWGSCRRQ